MLEGGKNNPLFIKADLLAQKVYEITKDFPRHEMYGITSQLRRAGLSVILNITEGFARQDPKEYRRFLLISFGSLKEAKYLLHFSLKQEYLKEEDFKEVLSVADEIARILWSIINPK